MKMQRCFLVAFLLLLVPCVAQASLSEAIDATVRVYGTDGSPHGTAFCVEESGGKIWLLTCRHVAELGPQFTVRFYTQGRESAHVPAVVAATGKTHDVAYLVVETSRLGSYRPPCIPLATARPATGAVITSAGCSGGSWPTAWKGHVLGYEQFGGMGQTMVFRPTPAAGRSGSAIFNEDGTEVVGVLFAQDPQQLGYRWGYAVPVEEIRRSFQDARWTYTQARAAKGELEPVSILRHMPTPVPYGVEELQCPGGQCPPSGGGGGYILPYRQEMDERMRGLEGYGQQYGQDYPVPDQGGGLFPGLPGDGGAQQIPVPDIGPTPGTSPAVDTETRQRLDTLWQHVSGLTRSHNGLAGNIGGLVAAAVRGLLLKWGLWSGGIGLGIWGVWWWGKRVLMPKLYHDTPTPIERGADWLAMIAQLTPWTWDDVLVNMTAKPVAAMWDNLLDAVAVSAGYRKEHDPQPQQPAAPEQQEAAE